MKLHDSDSNTRYWGGGGGGGGLGCLLLLAIIRVSVCAEVMYSCFCWGGDSSTLTLIH